MRAKPKVERPNIYRYHDYREFLRDWIAFRKKSERRFSLRSLGKESGLAFGFLSMVLTGKRVLSEAAAAKLAPALGLQRTEISYFRNLVTLGATDDPAERHVALEKMRRFLAYREENAREVEVYRYLTRWYYVAIREMSCFPDFRADAQWISERLYGAVPIAAAQEALDFLVSNGYLDLLPDGSAKQPEKRLDCQGGVFRIALGQLHREMLGLAADSIEKVSSERRSILGHTVGLSEAGFQKAKAILDEAFEKISDLGAAEKGGEWVYHAELALFPVAGRVKP